MSCIVVLDGRGDIYAQTMNKGQVALNAAKDLVAYFSLNDRAGDWFHYTVVEETDDPGKARILGRGKTVIGTFQMPPMPDCTCSFDDSEEMTRHAPLCAVTKSGWNW